MFTILKSLFRADTQPQVSDSRHEFDNIIKEMYQHSADMAEQIAYRATHADKKAALLQIFVEMDQAIADKKMSIKEVVKVLDDLKKNLNLKYEADLFILITQKKTKFL